MKPHILILIAVCASLAAYAQPTTDPDLLWNDVTVYRDEWGVPHIFGNTVRSVAFGFGYAQAQDHLEAMLRAYRVANGRIAELLGEEYAASDIFALRMGHEQLAAAAFPTVDPLTRDLCEGFALGVNVYMADEAGGGPSWADGVRPHDILALLHCFLTSFAPFDAPGLYHRPKGMISGNAWAIGPGRSTTGQPVLVINPHTDYGGTFQWYEAHIALPGINLQGATLFGLPVILQGHNDYLGWAVTPNESDFADVYVLNDETNGPDDANSLLQQQDPRQLWAAYVASLVTVREYKVANSAGLETRTVDCIYSPEGFGIGQYENKVSLLRVAGIDEFGALRQFFQMGASENLGDFQEAMASRQIPCFHIVYADRDGNIFYLYNTRAHGKALLGPIDKENEPGKPTGTRTWIDWTKPVSGGASTFQWGGMLPTETLPSLLNPPDGFIQVCGTPPWGVTFNPGMAADAWPAWLIRDVDSYRARRARHLLGLGTRSFIDMQSMTYDVLNPFAIGAVPRLIELTGKNKSWTANAHPDTASAVAVLKEWNYVADTESEGMTVFNVWLAALRNLAPQFNADPDLFDAFEFGDMNPQLGLEALDHAARLMRNDLGGVHVPWGDVHVARRGDREVKIPGASSGQPLFYASADTFQDGKWLLTKGFGYAAVVQFGERPETVSMVPFGASESASSPHFADQLDLMAERRFKLTRFEIEDVERYAVAARGGTMRLRPAGMDGLFIVRPGVTSEARMKSALAPPAPLPNGFAAFSVFATPEYLASAPEPTIEMEIHIPQETCPREHLSRLAICAWRPETGWQPLQLQENRPDERNLLGRDAGTATYAVLGPRDLFTSLHGEPQPQTEQSQSPGTEPASSTPTRASAPSTAPTRPVEKQTVPGQPDLLAPEIPVEPEPNQPAGTGAASPPAPVVPGAPVAPNAPAGQNPGSSPKPVSPEPVKNPVAWGRVVQLIIPGRAGDIRVTADKIIGARLASQASPAEPPSGMAFFTEAYAIETSSPDAVTEVAVYFTAPAARCAEQNLLQLAVYAFAEGEGWTRIEGQQFIAQTGLFVASDAKPRTYALIGPVSCLIPSSNP